MSAGADCANMLSDSTREMTLEEFIEFLTPDEATKKGGAIVMSSRDFENIKNTIEIACVKLGNSCSPQMKEGIKKISKTLKDLTSKKESSIMQITAIPKFNLQFPDPNTLVIQKALNEKGFKVAEDSYYGKKTKAAVSAFQKKNGLTGTGNLGPKTIDLLGIKIVTRTVTGGKTITQDMAGKQDRRLIPEMRILLEDKVFPDGVVPSCFKKKDIQACYILVMEKMAELGIFESGGNNKGLLVGYAQGVTGKYTKGGNGDAWCLDYCQCGIALIEDYYEIESPVIGSAHCMTTLNAAKKIQGLVSEVAEVGTLALGQKGKTASGHAMAVIELTSKTKMKTSEGNTSISDIRDGDGSGIKLRNQITNGSLVTRGFVRLYPNNKLPKA